MVPVRSMNARELPVPDLDYHTLRDIQLFVRACRSAINLSEAGSPEVFDAVVRLERVRKETIANLKKSISDKSILRKTVRWINSEFNACIENVKSNFLLSN